MTNQLCIYDKQFWEAVDKLLEESELVIDRSKGSVHPRYPSIRYEVDYGYLDNTTSMDGGGIDVWLGSNPTRKADAIICTIDLFKRDSEIKLLIGCSDQEKLAVYNFHNNSSVMKGILIQRMV